MARDIPQSPWALTGIDFYGVVGKKTRNPHCVRDISQGLFWARDHEKTCSRISFVEFSSPDLGDGRRHGDEGARSATASKLAGFYIGGNIGGAWGNRDGNYSTDPG